MKTTDIQIRDPFILPVESEGKYYLYGTTDKNCWGDTATGFDVYISDDLEQWEGPFEAFRPDRMFWADRNFWAPEVYYYNSQYYMFASFKSKDASRGTQVLISDKASGPFKPLMDKPITPSGWECLDGTLYIDEKNTPWIVFCHEWTQAVDGQMCAAKLTEDLKNTMGEVEVLFKASDASWTRGSKRKFNEAGIEVEKTVYVTDGPYLYKTSEGQLLMLWSSGGEKGYAMGIAVSQSGDIRGPWVHESKPLYEKDGGHGMIFRTFENQLMFTIHSPNKTPNERPAFIAIEEKDGKLEIKK
jgi:beta-xylosidase